MNWKRIVLLLAVLVVLAAGTAYWRLTSAPPPVPADMAEPTIPVAAPEARVEAPEEKARRQLVGTFQDQYKGKRTMTLNADGTGVMRVELSGIEAMLSAPTLRFDMKWSLKDQILSKVTVSGEPADKVNLILNMMGNTSNETVLEVNEDHLLTLDQDGKTKYDWKRVKTDGAKKDK